jgi:hypothetical protein
MRHVHRVCLQRLAVTILLSLAGAAAASAAPRLWLFTPVLSGRVSPEFAARPVEATTRLAAALRADSRVTLADSIDEADVIVEVGAVRRTSYTQDGEKQLEHVILTITAGKTRSVLQASAPRARDAEADAARQLLAWVHDHGDLLDPNRPR